MAALRLGILQYQRVDLITDKLQGDINIMAARKVSFYRNSYW